MALVTLQASALAAQSSRVVASAVVDSSRVRRDTVGAARRDSVRTPWAAFDKYFQNDSSGSATPSVSLPAVSQAPKAPPAPAERIAAAAVTAPAPRIDSAPATPPPAKPAAAASVSHAMETTAGSLKLTGWIQAWYTNGDAAADHTFRLRRAEMRFFGQISPRVSWVLDFDAAKLFTVNNTYVDVNGTRVVSDESVNQASRMLQDGFISVSAWHGMIVDAGQFKIPFASESFAIPTRFETVEQPMYVTDRARGGAIAAVRDMGAMVRGSTTRVSYYLGAFNGSGELQTSMDRNDRKALVGRVLYRPIPGTLQVGASGVVGGAATTESPRRDRAGLEMLLTHAALTLRSDYISANDAALHRAGVVVTSTYRLRPTLQAVARFDSWDPDTDLETTAASVTAREALVGVNQLLAGSNARLQLNVARRAYAHDLIKPVTTMMVNVEVGW